MPNNHAPDVLMNPIQTTRLEDAFVRYGALTTSHDLKPYFNFLNAIIGSVPVCSLLQTPTKTFRPAFVDNSELCNASYH